MAVVINDFEVMPQTPADDNKKAANKADGKSAEKSEMTDQEIKQLLERRAERFERTAGH